MVAVLTLGVGIGANTAIYSLIQAVMLHPLPFPEPQRLFQIWESAEREELELRSLSFPMLEDLRGADDIFESVSGSLRVRVNLGGAEGPERVLAEGVTSEYFEMFGARAVLGRALSDEDARRDAVQPAVVLSEAFWRRRFGGDPEVVGENVFVNEVATMVVGVSSGQGRRGDVDVWFPIEAAPILLPDIGERRFEARGARWLSATGRVRAGVSRESLDAWMARETARLRSDFPDVMERRGVLAIPLEEQIFGDVQQTATILMIAVGLVMLIACANLANLLLARGVERRGELALRLAIGASPYRLVRQLLTESLLLSFAGGAVGLVLALWSEDILKGVSLFEQLPGYVRPGIDLETLAFTGLLCIVTAFVFGTAPALAAARMDLSSARAMRGQRPAVRGVLVSAQVALAVLLTVASGLMLRSLSRQLQIDPGFQSASIHTLRVQLPARRYDGDAALGFYRTLEERLAAIAGIRSVAFSSDVPLVDGYSARSMRVEDGSSDAKEDAIRVYHHSVSPGFFTTLGIRLLSGRDFSSFDDADARLVAMVNRKLAARAWPGEEPVGKRIGFGSNGAWRTVIGVVDDIRYRDLVLDPVNSPDDPDIYLPLTQSPSRTIGVVLRVETAEPDLEMVRSAVSTIDAGIPVYEVSAMSDILDDQLALPRLSSWLLSLFGGVALSLAALGLYGLLGHHVAQRSRDIGIELALGASASNILRRVVAHGLALAGTGMVAGLVASLVLGRFLENRLFEVSAHDPWTFAACTVVLSAVSVVASYLPARKATRLDPVIALRQP